MLTVVYRAYSNFFLSVRLVGSVFNFTDRTYTAADLPLFMTLDSTLQMAAVCSSYTLVPMYQTARYHNPNTVVRIFTAVQTPYLTNFISVLSLLRGGTVS